MKTCSNCGYEVSTPFCPHCGAPVPQEDDGGTSSEVLSAQMPEPASQPADNATPVMPVDSTPGGTAKASKPFYKKKGAIIAIAFALLVIIGGAFSGISGEQGNSNSAQPAVNNSESTTVANEESKEVTVSSIDAEYDGSAEAGEVLDEYNYDITVIATYSDGSEELVTDWTVSKPATLKAGKESTVLIEYEGQDTQLTVKCTSLTAKQYKESCKSYPYKKLAKYPTKYEGKNIKLTGKVIQVLDDGSDTINLRINVTEGSYGIWDDTVFVIYEYSGDDEERVLEDDIVTVWGVFTGQYSYESTLGATITIPGMQAEYLSVND